MKIRYLSKCLLIEDVKEKVLVIGDLHIGESGGRIEGIDIKERRFDEMIEELNIIFRIINIKAEGKRKIVDKIILLGDLKHDFSSLSWEERNGLVNLFDYLDDKCEEIIIIRGNHDNYLLNLTSKRRIKIYDNYVWKGFCFLHGNRDFKEIYRNEIKCWVMGHLHPAIVLREGIKSEKYKCFLEGSFKNKKIIVLPSFSISEGIDVLELLEKRKNNLAWDFDLKKFTVKIVDSDKMEVVDFGKLKKIKLI